MKTKQILHSMALLVTAMALAAGLSSILPTRPVYGQTITVDGNPAEWNPAGWEMDAPTNVDTGHIGRDASNNGQYIWTDTGADMRTDGTDPDTNYDLTEFRATGDASNIYFALTFTNITDTNLPYVSIAIDSTLDGNGMNWFGDSADTMAHASALWETLIVVNLYKTGYYNPTWTWTNAGASYIDATNDAIEISMPWTALGVTPGAHLRFTVLVGEHDGSGGIVDSDGSSDALDVITNYGDPGSTNNTWVEVSDGTIDYYFDIWFQADGNPFAPIVISKLLHDCPGTEPYGEWVQIANVSGQTIDLTNYKIGDEETLGEGEGMERLASASLTYLAATVAGNRGSVFAAVYGSNPDYEFTDTNATPDTVNYSLWTGGSVALANTGDELLLLDDCDTVIDVVAWGGGSYPGVNSAASPGENVSMERNFQGNTPEDTNNTAVDFSTVSGGGDPLNGPTAVTLASFDATPQDDAILVTWETASELDNVGFNLYRSEAADGPYTLLNDTLIPPQFPGEIMGGYYEWLDTDVLPGVTYYYKLEDIDVKGVSTFHGPVNTSIVTAPTAVGLRSVSARGVTLSLALGVTTILGVVAVFRRRR